MPRIIETTGDKIAVSATVTNDDGELKAYVNLDFVAPDETVRITLEADDFAAVVRRLHAFVEDLEQGNFPDA